VLRGSEQITFARTLFVWLVLVIHAPVNDMVRANSSRNAIRRVCCLKVHLFLAHDIYPTPQAEIGADLY
jgi:hypothetical protein